MSDTLNLTKGMIGAICLYEALGSAMWLIALNWSSNALIRANLGPVKGIIGISYYFDISVAVWLFIAYLICVRVSGAHFNPAVTIAVFIQDRDFSRQKVYVCLLMILF